MKSENAREEDVLSRDLEELPVPAKGKMEKDIPYVDDVVYTEGIRLILLVTGLVIAVFVISMDFTILATAIPRITADFHSIDDVGWYGSVYLLTTTAFQPWFGKLYTLFNAKWVYLTAMGIFEVGSLIIALSTSSHMLIVGRAVAGVGASAIFSGGATIIGFSVPLHSRAIYLGILSSMFGIASVVGPVIGGALTDRVTWRWCFWINLPLGGVVMLVVSLFFTPPRNYIGTILLIGAVVSILLALQFGGSEPWSEAKVYGCLISFFILLGCFIFVEFKVGDKAAVPLRLFRNRTVWSASLVSGFLIMSMYDHVYYLPFYFQAVKGYSASRSGVCSIPYFLSLALSSIGGGFAIAHLGSYVEFAWAGTALLTTGAGILSTLRVSSSTGTWIGFQIICGFGVGLAIQTPFIAVQTAVSGTDMPLGMAITIFFNSLGGALGISIAQNVFIQGLHKYIPRYTTGVDVEQVIDAGATHVSENPTTGLLFAYNLAISDTFRFAIAAAGVAFVVSLFMERRRTKESTSA